MIHCRNDPTLKTMLKHWNKPSILAIEGNLKNNSVITFRQITLEELLKEIGNLNSSKSSQDIYSDEN